MWNHQARKSRCVLIWVDSILLPAPFTKRESQLKGHNSYCYSGSKGPLRETPDRREIGQLRPKQDLQRAEAYIVQAATGRLLGATLRAPHTASHRAPLRLLQGASWGNSQAATGSLLGHLSGHLSGNLAGCHRASLGATCRAPLGAPCKALFGLFFLKHFIKHLLNHFTGCCEASFKKNNV